MDKVNRRIQIFPLVATLFMIGYEMIEDVKAGDIYKKIASIFYEKLNLIKDISISKRRFIALIDFDPDEVGIFSLSKFLQDQAILSYWNDRALKS